MPILVKKLFLLRIVRARMSLTTDNFKSVRAVVETDVERS